LAAASPAVIHPNLHQVTVAGSQRVQRDGAGGGPTISAAIKNFIIGISASLLTIVPVLIFYYEKFGNIFATFLNFSSTSSTTTGTFVSATYNPNIFYFVEGFPSFIGPQGITVLLIIVLGTFLYLFIKFRRNNKDKTSVERSNLKNNTTKIKLLLFAILTIVFLGSFDKTSYLVSEVLFLLIAIIFYDITKNMNIKDLDLHTMFFAWFMAFFIFSSVFVIKDNRYFLLMAPPVIYFMILGLHEISNAFNLRIKDRNVIFPVLAIMLTVIIVLSTATQIPNILQANNDKVTTNEQIELASQWFVSYDPNYKNQNIYSDIWPNFSWYLKTNVKMIPTLSAYVANPDGIKNYTINQADMTAFNNYLITNNADYYLSDIPGLNLKSYTSIKDFGNVTIYKKKT